MGHTNRHDDRLMQDWGWKTTPFMGTPRRKEKKNKMNQTIVPQSNELIRDMQLRTRDGYNFPIFDVEYMVDGISEILPGMLYQSGTIYDERIITDHGITVIFNFTREKPVAIKPSWPLAEVSWPYGDGNIADVDITTLHRLAKIAAESIRSGHRVLSHCQMGWNRSGLFTGMVMHELEFEGDIVSHIKKQRGTGALSNYQYAMYLRRLQYPNQVFQPITDVYRNVNTSVALSAEAYEEIFGAV